MKIVLDIETIPCSEDDRVALGLDDEERYRATALDANFGRIFCVGYLALRDDGNPGAFSALYGASESNLLRTFWEHMKAFPSPYIIAHNGLRFDLPFLWKRSVVQGTLPAFDLRLVRFRTDYVYDTMAVWTNWELRSGIKLDTLAKILNVPQKSGSGDQVFDMWRAGQWREIADYCLDDVYVTYACYSKMTFSPYLPKSSLTKTFAPIP